MIAHRTTRALPAGAALLLAGALAVPHPAARAQAEPQIPAGDQCALCHHDLDDEAVDVIEFFRVDVHGRAGLSCADCHGGDRTSDDPDQAMSKAGGFVGAPGPLETPEFCSRCHSSPEYMRRFNPRLPVDQLQLYQTSIHGKLNARGDGKVATCVSCHGAHTIRPASEPFSSVHPQRVAETCGHCHADSTYMAPYGIPTDQKREYLGSVHATALMEEDDLSAPTCNDCHGNHGAFPPEVESISAVCGQCHVQQRELFSQSPKKAIFDDMDLPECETCHGNHAIVHASDALIGLHEGAVCAGCHDDDGSEPSRTILAMDASLDSLRADLDGGKVLLDQATQKGMYVVDAEYTWGEARQKLFEARTEIHAFNLQALLGVTDEGRTLTADVLEAGKQALADYRFRRNGLLVSTLVLTLLAVSLYLKIRRMERHRAGSS